MRALELRADPGRGRYGRRSARCPPGTGGRSPMASRSVTSSSLGSGQSMDASVPKSDQDEPRAVLRDAVPVAVEDPRIDRVAKVAQSTEEARQHGAVVPGRKVGHILNEHGVRRAGAPQRA